MSSQKQRETNEEKLGSVGNGKATPIPTEQPQVTPKQSPGQAQASNATTTQDGKKAVPTDIPKPKEQLPLQIPDILEKTAERYLNKKPSTPRLFLHGTCQQQTVAVWVSPPGAGKTTGACQLCVAQATGMAWLNHWDVSIPGRALFLSVEDPEDAEHYRMYHALRELEQNLRNEAAKNIYAPYVYGDVTLFSGKGNQLETTTNFLDLENLIKRIQSQDKNNKKPLLIILDTFSRFIGTDEMDNPGTTKAFGYLERLCKEYDCVFLIIHHPTKGAGKYIVTEQKELETQLDATASSGARAIAGSARCVFNSVPLSEKLAIKLIGDKAKGKGDGFFLAMRASKKNYGKPERRFYLTRDEHGLLSEIEPEVREKVKQSLEEDLADFMLEIEQRNKNGDAPINSTGQALQLGDEQWTRYRVQQVIAYGLKNEKLVEIQNKGKAGKFVSLAHFPDQTENE